MSEEKQVVKTTLKDAKERQKWHIVTDYKNEPDPEHWGMRCGLFHHHTDIYWAEDKKQFFVGVCTDDGYWPPKYFDTVFECMWYVETLSNEWDEDGHRRLDDPGDYDEDEYR